MANTLKLKHRLTTGAPAQLETGEPAVSIADKKLWIGDAAKNPVLLAEPLVKTYYLGTITGSTLTKTSGTATVARVAIGEYTVTASASAALIVVVDDQLNWGEDFASAAGGNRKLIIRDADKLGRPKADPTNIYVMVIE